MLIWVSWKLFRELRHKDRAPGDMTEEECAAQAARKPKTFRQAVIQVVLADQPYARDSKVATGAVLRDAGLTVSDFVRVKVGA